MRIRFLLLLVIIAFCSYKEPVSPNFSINGKKTIIIEGRVHPLFYDHMINLKVIPAEFITYVKSADLQIFEKKTQGKIKWAIPADKPVYIYGSFFGNQYRLFSLAEPGDSIYVDYMENKPVFSGKGAAKFELAYRLLILQDSLKKVDFSQELLGKEFNSLKSVEEFFTWNHALNTKANAVLSIINSYKGKITSYALNVIKETSLYPIEKIRIIKFYNLVNLNKQLSINASENIVEIESQFTNKELCSIYDSTVNGVAGNWLRRESPVVDDPYYLYYRIDADMLRQKGEFYSEKQSDQLLPKERIDRYVAKYHWVKENYKEGKVKEELLAFFFHYVRGVLFNFGFDPKIEAILADYYARPGYPEYKLAVKKYELAKRASEAKKGNINFSFTDITGREFNKDRLKGKIAIFDFWFTGCTGCVQLTPTMKKVEEALKVDTNVIFVNVSVDGDKTKWLKSIKSSKYTTGNGLALYTGGQAKEHAGIRQLGIEGYPNLLILDIYGKVIGRFPEYDPRKDSGQKLLLLINKQRAIMKDGPYILRRKGSSTVYTINGLSLNDQLLLKNAPLEVQTDVPGKFFSLELQERLQAEPTVFPQVGKLFVLSDIEGEFTQLRTLLQANGIIDNQFNWTFGDGHLVFGGDMFDRGNQVTECLWLIYSLEQKAKAAGGYIHFILGNHEIMNLQGDKRYHDEKYKVNEMLIGKSLTELYGENSELGRWLRTKNIVEKIGNILFLHGGISRKLNNVPIGLTELNATARPYYGNRTAAVSDNELVKTIFNSETSPFWYRSYYTDNPAKKLVMEQVIDSTLQKFAVNHIITGHTVIADTISTHYNGKIINTDTQHAEGYSEALLIEDDVFYRVNAKGEKTILFRRSEKANTRSIE